MLLSSLSAVATLSSVRSQRSLAGFLSTRLDLCIPRLAVEEAAVFEEVALAYLMVVSAMLFGSRLQADRPTISSSFFQVAESCSSV